MPARHRRNERKKEVQLEFDCPCGTVHVLVLGRGALDSLIQIANKGKGPEIHLQHYIKKPKKPEPSTVIRHPLEYGEIVHNSDTTCGICKPTDQPAKEPEYYPEQERKEVPPLESPSRKESAKTESDAFGDGTGFCPSCDHRVLVKDGKCPMCGGDVQT